MWWQVSNLLRLPSVGSGSTDGGTGCAGRGGDEIKLAPPSSLPAANRLYAIKRGSGLAVSRYGEFAT
jgi:hypothetical protein